MTSEIKGLHFEADKGFDSGDDDVEVTPRDRQREAVIEKRGLQGAEELEEEYRKIDENMEEVRKKLEADEQQ
ncbi:MAG: hypothetical protein ACC618_01945 [Patescibacteria group bacterium]